MVRGEGRFRIKSVIAARAIGLLAAGALLGCNGPVVATDRPVATTSPTAIASTATAAPTTAATTATPALTTAAPNPTAAATTAAPTQAPTQSPTVAPTPTLAATLQPTSTPSPTPNLTPTPGLTPTSPPAGTLAARYLQSADIPPLCPLAASDAPVCAISFPASRSYHAAVDEYLLFRLGWADPSQLSCDAFVRNTTTTFTIDGRGVAWVWISCRFMTSGVNAQNWFADMRYLSAPLSPGTHSATATITYNSAVPGTGGGIPAGTVQTWTPTVTVP